MNENTGLGRCPSCSDAGGMRAEAAYSASLTSAAASSSSWMVRP